MISTNYELPFAFSVPEMNPWDGRRPVDVSVVFSSGDGVASSNALKKLIEPFWLLASTGALAGDTNEPQKSTCSPPTISAQDSEVRVHFEACQLDEKATHCLLSLLLAAHDENAVQNASVGAPGLARRPIVFDPQLENPYPVAFSRVPFRSEIEDSESETRILRATAVEVVSPEQEAGIEKALANWAARASRGAYGIAPVDPFSCGCLPTNPIEFYQSEVYWAVEKCRFHPAAVGNLLNVCVALHATLVRFSEVVIE